MSLAAALTVKNACSRRAEGSTDPCELTESEDADGSVLAVFMSALGRLLAIALRATRLAASPFVEFAVRRNIRIIESELKGWFGIGKT